MVPDYQQLSTQLKLLAHPERLRILDLLRREPVCVCHLEALLDKPQPYISQQLRAARSRHCHRRTARPQHLLSTGRRDRGSVA
ncbi:MAG: ArsR family transcriptional regulator [Caldilineaceae bacterium]